MTRINESLTALQQSRGLRIREAETALRKLSRNLKSLETNYDETVSTHEPARHAQEILELDAQKFRIAKAASDLEIESERLEGDLEMLKERLAELEAQGLEGDETVRREREADDATMYAFLVHRAMAILTVTDCVSRFIAPLGLTLKPTTLGITTRLSFETVAKAMSMWSTSIRSSLSFSMQTTFGKPCKVNACLELFLM